ncbi:YwdI family protein [Heyndrickxia coagulans]|uniref:YwdI family protein n=1 Tax=Heyndrickxia coagulans TaxID=1398 RepID=UPI0023E44CA9|nr:YwdI family protein [Heyndrickxia coagulans]
MAITTEMLLEKMEQELAKAKQAMPAEQLREHIYAVKALCEVLLESGKAEQPLPAGPSVPKTVLKPEPLKMEDGANGDSIFDF